MESRIETTTTKKTTLESIGDAQRTILISKNSYTYSDEYSSNHQNALSDGDEKGKGETDKGIGSKIDILTRRDNLTKNIYNNDMNGYGESNPNALSDGDERGKGELGNSIGSKTDINKRNESVVKNTFKETKPYPDFI
jgi:hypothetical protein